MGVPFHLVLDAPSLHGPECSSLHWPLIIFCSHCSFKWKSNNPNSCSWNAFCDLCSLVDPDTLGIGIVINPAFYNFGELFLKHCQYSFSAWILIIPCNRGIIILVYGVETEVQKTSASGAPVEQMHSICLLSTLHEPGAC